MKRLFQLLATCLFMPAAASAQNVPAPVVPAASPTPAAAASADPSAGGSGCELHVFPTRNFVAMDSGMLSGLGLVGVLADAAAHKDKVKSVKEQMADDLTPAVQMAQLGKAGLTTTLRMPPDTKVVTETSFPTAEEIKQDPAAKAKSQELIRADKAGKRLTSSISSCYAELAIPYVFYQKAAMYGTRIFTAFVFRDFTGQVNGPQVSKGQVEQHVPGFPAATPEQEDAAKAALVDAFGQDLTKWAQLKLHKG